MRPTTLTTTPSRHPVDVVSSHLSGGSLVREFTSSRVIRVGRVDRVRVRVSVRFSGRYKNLGPPFIGLPKFLYNTIQ